MIEKISGSDITKAMKEYDKRAKGLPEGYQNAWNEIIDNLWQYTDFTGRNLIPIFEKALELLEITSAEGQGIEEVLGNDVKGFCSELADCENVKSYRDKWREKLNRKVIKKSGESK